MVISSEAELLLCCARVVMDEARATRIRELLRGPINWQELFRLATTHRVLPLLYWHLHTVQPDAVPTEPLSQLRQRFERNAHRNLFLARELVNLLKLLTAHDLPALAFKGPTLASAAYGNLALRQFTDLDVLIRDRDVQGAKALLVAEGFHAQLELTPPQETSLLRSDCQLALTRGDGAVEVELHWGIAPRYFSCPLEKNRFWERVKTVQLGGAKVPSLSREDLLLTLCVHGAKHLWGQLNWICDVAELVRNSAKLEWEAIHERAMAAGAERMLWLGLFLARHVLGATLPDPVARSLDNQPELKRLADKVRTGLFAQSSRSPELFERSAHQPLAARVLFHPFHLQVRERFADKVRYCLRLACTPGIADWQWIRLPSALYFLYYLLRPMRLAGKYTRRLAPRLRHQT